MTKEPQPIEETIEQPTVDTAFEFIKDSGGIEEYRCILNDLSVLLLEDHSAPVATFMVTYHVGSRNEAIGYTGSTHLLEHMMFKGTEKFNKENGNDIVNILQDIGAQINATTWNDRTNYYELLPSEHLYKAIEIEADRMRNLLIKDEDRQPEMTVVRNEFERGENDPFSALNKNIWATAYQAHPYHHNTIGWKSDIEGVSTERLKQFYNEYYWPNNATVTIIGDFDKQETLKKILDEYGSIPKSPKSIPEMYTTEPKQEGARRLVVKRSGETGIVGIAHKTPEGLNEDYFAIQVLARVLGEGKSSRLYKKLVDKGLATSLFMWDYPFRDNSLFITYVFLTPDTKHEEVEKIILDEYELIKENGITDQELARAKGQTKAQLAYVRDGSFSIASVLNEAIAIGDWTNYTKFLEKTNAIVKTDVQNVANKYLLEDKSTTGYFVPIKGSGGGGGIPPEKNSAKQYHNYSTETGNSIGTDNYEGTSIAENIIEFEPVKGLRLLTMKTGVQDVVTIRGSILGGDVFSPQANRMIADLTAAMLDKGTRDKSKFEIADRLEAVGATISFSSGQQHVRFSVKCLKDDIPLVLGLLAEQLREPAFNKEDLRTLKKRIKGNLMRDKESTSKMAGGEFIRELYPKDHPNYRYSIDEQIEMIEKIDRASLRNFHKTYYGLGNMIMVAVGDVDGKYFSSEVEKVFKGWKTSPLNKWKRMLSAKDAVANTKYVTIKDKTSTDIYIGLTIGIDRTHDDYYPLMIGTYILGGNFSARLMQTVRDEKGLTYGISAQIQGVDNGNDGYLTIWSTFSPQLLQTGYEATLEQLKKWVTDGITADELNAKKTTITGSYKVGLANTNGMAAQILSNSERGRPNEYLDQFPAIINNLTIEQVNIAIEKYIDTDKLVFVAAGSIDQEGNPID
jgi:zinc protease